MFKISFPLLFLRFFIPTLTLQFLFFSGCTSTSYKSKQPRRPQARFDVTGQQMAKSQLFFAGCVVTGYNQRSSYSSLENWCQNNFRYGQNIINVGGKGTPESRKKLTNFYKTAFTNFEHPEFEVSILKTTNTEGMAFVFAIDNESVIAESFGEINSLNVELSGQIIVFNLKDQMIMASYPLILSAKTKNDANSNIQALLNELYYKGWSGDDQEAIGFLDYFVQTLKEKVSLTFYYDALTINRIGVSSVNLEKIAISNLKEHNINQSDFEQKVAQDFLSYLAKNQNVAIVPFGATDSNNRRTLDIVPGGANMASRFKDTSFTSLTIPEPTFAIDLTMRGFKEAEVDRTNIEKALGFGSFINMKVINAADQSTIFDENFRNHLIRVVPLDSNFDSWPWLNGSLKALIEELTSNLSDPNSKWCKDKAQGSKTRNSLRNLYSTSISTCLSPLPNS